jgi:hypothetical protein
MSRNFLINFLIYKGTFLGATREFHSIVEIVEGHEYIKNHREFQAFFM